MVSCTAANKINAPVPALKLRKANENARAYKNRAAAEIHPPPDSNAAVPRKKRVTIHKVMAPVINRTAV